MNCTYVFNKMIGPFCDPYIRGIASKGGTRSSKTWSVLQLLYLVANESTEPLMISCVTDTLPAVKRGMFRAFQNMLLVVLCFPLAQYYYARHMATQAHTRLHLSLRDMLFTWNQLAVLGMVAGMLLRTAGIERPPVLGTLFQSLVHIGAWTSLLPVGYLMDFRRARAYYRRILDLLPLRFIIIPAIIYALIKPLFTDQIILGTLMIIAATPTAINAVVTSRLYKLNVDLAVAAFLLTTTVFLFLVFPLLFFYIQGGGQF